MGKKIVNTSSARPRVRNTSPPPVRLDRESVAQALDAEVIGELPRGGPLRSAPVVVRYLQERVRSSGGRPGIAGATTRIKVPLTDEQAAALGETTAEISSQLGYTPSTAQVANYLIELGLETLRATTPLLSDPDARAPASGDQMRELAELTAEMSLPPGLRPPTGHPPEQLITLGVETLRAASRLFGPPPWSRQPG